MTTKPSKGFLVTLLGGFALSLATANAAREESPDEFRKNLESMLDKTERSVSILRDQIMSSQTAPFAPDLYLQLGELLSQKASTLYYIQMEREQKTETTSRETKRLSAVTEAQKEAIEIFERILRDYPKYEKRPKVMYLLCVSLKSIDEVPRFLGWVGKLIAEYPVSEEAMRGRLLLGQHWYDGGNQADALETLRPVLKFSSAYERNMARYRSAMIHLATEKPKEALALLERIILDPDLRDGDSPAEVSLKTKEVKSSLKREALVDSVRAYTTVYPDSADPILYYSKIAPNELLFYEAIEKLAFRYVTLKRFDSALKLLRTLGQRTSDPQRVVNVYRDVLSSIPPEQRVEISPSEVKLALQKHSQWINFFDVPREIATQSTAFFEKQVRDLGTRSHDLSMQATDPKQKSYYLSRAREYYLVYLAHYHIYQTAQKVAANLASVYFAQGSFLESAELYLRIFQGEFGQPTDRVDLIENVITSAQKEVSSNFYDQLRIRGVLIRAIKSYIAAVPRMQSDARLNFLYAKTRYEQGYQEESIPELFTVMQKFRSTKYAADAGDIILDHYNTRKDFDALTEWTGRFLSLGIKDAAFLDRVARVQKSASLRRLDEVVKAQTGSGPLTGGKNYLQAALGLSDEGLKDTALKLALAKSKEERDIDTFFKTAEALAAKETDAKKQLEIQRSIAKENLRITRFYQGVARLQIIYTNSRYAQTDRLKAFEEAAETALLLRDWNLIGKMFGHPLWKSTSRSLQEKTKSQLADLLESPIATPVMITDQFMESNPSESFLVAALKAKSKLSQGTFLRAAQIAKTNCQSGRDSALCRWVKVSTLEKEKIEFVPQLERGPASVQAVEERAKSLASLISSYQSLEGGEDAQLNMVAALRQHELMKKFAGFLKTIAGQQPKLAAVLQQKAKESLDNAAAALGRCATMATRSGVVTPMARYCGTGEAVPLPKLLQWSRLQSLRSESADPAGTGIRPLQVDIFAGGGAEPLLGLGDQYLSQGKYAHASASAQIGLVSHPERDGDFRSILGCSLVKLGFLSEASFHLRKATASGRTEACLKSLTSAGGA